MTWRAVVHRDDVNILCAKAESVTSRGSLMIETRLAAQGVPQTILAMPLSIPHQGTLTLKSVPGGGIVLVITQNGAVYHATVKYEAGERLDSIRVTYSWDMRAGKSRLAIEQPDRQAARWSHVETAIGLAPADLAHIGGDFDLAGTHPDLIFAAMSDHVEPVGPSPGLSINTSLDTTYGHRALANIQRADQLITQGESGGQIVLAKIERIVPALGSFAPVRLRAPYFGLSQDIVVAPDQRMLIGGSEVEYIFGCEQVLVSARHLVNGTAARWDGGGPLAHYAQCILPSHVPMNAAGAWVESLYVGRIRRNAAMLRETLLKTVDPMFLPEQARAPFRVLSPFEAITLAERRAA